MPTQAEPPGALIDTSARMIGARTGFRNPAADRPAAGPPPVAVSRMIRELERGPWPVRDLLLAARLRDRFRCKVNDGLALGGAKATCTNERFHAGDRATIRVTGGTTLVVGSWNARIRARAYVNYPANTTADGSDSMAVQQARRLGELARHGTSAIKRTSCASPCRRPSR